jgi:hypothetical protein
MIVYRSEEYQPKQSKKREYQPIIEENEEMESPRMNNGYHRDRDIKQVKLTNNKTKFKIIIYKIKS